MSESDQLPWWSESELQEYGNEYEEYFAKHPEVDYKPYYDLEQSIGYTDWSRR
jgi:hypothetical protein